MVTTNDDDTGKLLRMLRNYGQEKKYYHVMRGYTAGLTIFRRRCFASN